MLLRTLCNLRSARRAAAAATCVNSSVQLQRQQNSIAVTHTTQQQRRPQSSEAQTAEPATEDSGSAAPRVYNSVDTVLLSEAEVHVWTKRLSFVHGEKIDTFDPAVAHALWHEYTSSNILSERKRRDLSVPLMAHIKSADYNNIARLHFAYDIILSLLQSETWIHTYTVNMLLIELMHTGDRERVQTLFQVFTSVSTQRYVFRPNAHTVGIALTAFRRLSIQYNVLQVLTVIDRYSIQCTLLTYNSLLSYCCRHKHNDIGVHVFEQHMQPRIAEQLQRLAAGTADESTDPATAARERENTAEQMQKQQLLDAAADEAEDDYEYNERVLTDEDIDPVFQRKKAATAAAMAAAATGEQQPRRPKRSPKIAAARYVRFLPNGNTLQLMLLLYTRLPDGAGAARAVQLFRSMEAASRAAVVTGAATAAAAAAAAADGDDTPEGYTEINNHLSLVAYQQMIVACVQTTTAATAEAAAATAVELYQQMLTVDNIRPDVQFFASWIKAHLTLSDRHYDGSDNNNSNSSNDNSHDDSSSNNNNNISISYHPEAISNTEAIIALMQQQELSLDLSLYATFIYYFALHRKHSYTLRMYDRMTRSDGVLSSVQQQQQQQQQIELLMQLQQPSIEQQEQLQLLSRQINQQRSINASLFDCVVNASLQLFHEAAAADSSNHTAAATTTTTARTLSPATLAIQAKHFAKASSVLDDMQRYSIPLSGSSYSQLIRAACVYDNFTEASIHIEYKRRHARQQLTAKATTATTEADNDSSNDQQLRYIYLLPNSDDYSQLVSSLLRQREFAAVANVYGAYCKDAVIVQQLLQQESVQQQQQHEQPLKFGELELYHSVLQSYHIDNNSSTISNTTATGVATASTEVRAAARSAAADSCLSVINDIYAHGLTLPIDYTYTAAVKVLCSLAAWPQLLLLLELQQQQRVQPNQWQLLAMETRGKQMRTGKPKDPVFVQCLLITRDMHNNNNNSNNSRIGTSHQYMQRAQILVKQSAASKVEYEKQQAVAAAAAKIAAAAAANSRMSAAAGVDNNRRNNSNNKSFAESMAAQALMFESLMKSTAGASFAAAVAVSTTAANAVETATATATAAAQHMQPQVMKPLPKTNMAFSSKKLKLAATATAGRVL